MYNTPELKTTKLEGKCSLNQVSLKSSVSDSC